MLRSGVKTAILLTGNALYGQGLAVAGRIAQSRGAKLLAPYPVTRLERGGRSPTSGSHRLRPGASARAVEGVSPTHPGWRAGSDRVFRLSRQERSFHLTGMRYPHAGESKRRLYRRTRSPRRQHCRWLEPSCPERRQLGLNCRRAKSHCPVLPLLSAHCFLKMRLWSMNP